MGMPMTGNLVKRGFEVKAYDVNPQALEKCQELVRLIMNLCYENRV